ncbi:nuclear transport factor 2 family protein [Mycobacterium sp. pV006]|uniref:nuclear transport factor 2 family protein n=1 Tax=Mycobacterium sp. pV006 TaxID=3238983 RepID=UPI00351AD28E
MTNERTSATSILWDDLPQAVTIYLTAHRRRDAETALRVFADDASITDEGRTHTGRTAIADWLGTAGGEYTYTTEIRHAEQTGDADFVVLQHLEGDFPGGTADLFFRFTVAGGLITRLVIEPRGASSGP